MRTLKLQVQMTMDGFISGQNGAMDWMKLPWTEDLKDYVRKITEPVDTIVLGRKLAEGFIPHWAQVAKDPNHPEHEGGVKYATTQKIVFTKTLDRSLWENTEIATGDLAEEITALKHRPGKDIIAYGGGGFVSSLIKNRLIDELHLFVNPSALGNGMPIFQALSEMQRFDLADVQRSDCGIVVLKYTPGK